MDNASTAMDMEIFESNSEFSSDCEFELRPGTPDDLIEVAEDAKKDLLPTKSKARYQQAYEIFQKFNETKNATSNSERVLLSHFTEMKGSASTMWSRYSMLKSTLKIYDNVDISTYPLLGAFLKKKSKRYKPKKAKILTEAELRAFIDNAPDVVWLDVKVVCIFAIFGACRSHELSAVLTTDIVCYDDMHYVTIPDTKTGKPNGFAITGPLLNVVKQYQDLRPSNVESKRFFLNFQKGKCSVQAIGRNKFYKMPRRIAEYLNLPDPERYTGHSFRRSSATLYANTGANMEAIKRHTGHRSTKVCESYIDDSIGYKKKRGEEIMSALNCTSTSTLLNPSLGPGGHEKRATAAAITDSLGTSSVSVIPQSIDASVASSTFSIQPTSMLPSNSDSVIRTSLLASPLQATASASVTPTASTSEKSHDDNIASNTDAGMTSNDSFSASRFDDNFVLSQHCESNEVSTQQFMSTMDKRFAFYRCDNLSINFYAKEKK